MKFKLYKKIRDHSHFTGKFREAAHSICNLHFKVPQEIPVKFHNDSKYDYHFIIKELAEVFKGEFEWLEENTEKYMSFSVSIKKKNIIMVKQSHTKLSLLILAESCKTNYQALLITFLKLIITKIAKHA